MSKHDKADWFIDYVADGDGGRHYRVELRESDDGAVREYWFHYAEAAREFVRYAVFGEEV